MKSYSLYRDSSDACAWVKQDDEMIQSLPMDSQQPCFCIACRPEDEPAVSTDKCVFLFLGFLYSPEELGSGAAIKKS